MSVDDMFYTSATTGETVSLNTDGLFFGTALEMRGYEFDATVNLFGISDVMLKPVSTNVEVTVYDRTEWDILRRLAVRDTINNTPGTFTVLDKLGNKWLRKGNISADSLRKLPADVLTTSMKVNLYGYWEKQTLIPCTRNTVEDTGGMLDYPYDYPFDYGYGDMSTTLSVGGGVPAHATIRIYGHCVNPRIRIGANMYGVDTTVGVGERLDIDTYDKTIIRTVVGATDVCTIDEYPNRVKGNENTGTYVFQPIPIGQWDVSWSGSFSFEILLREQEVETPWIL